MRGKEDTKRYSERMGWPSQTRPKGPLIWFHAVSVGETMAIVPLIEAILESHISVLLTTGTVAASQLVGKLFAQRLIHQYAPIDFLVVIRRFLDYWKPDMMFACESEIWPIRIDELAYRSVPQILLNARISDNSFERWKRYAFCANEIFSKLTIVICQSDGDAKRYKFLGAQNVSISGNLKGDAVFPSYLSRDFERYREAIASRPTWAAISTHDGEELIAAQVHTILRKRYPDLLTIIVPRHISRITQLSKKLANKNYSFVRKSLNEFPTLGTDILIGDTIGDMRLYLGLTKIAFIGKSLMGEGGHNPLESAILGSAILSGPNIGNFKEIYKELMKDKAVFFVDDSMMLARSVSYLLERADVRREMIESARRTALRLSGGLKCTFDILKPFLNPLFLSAQLYRVEDV
ncbi:MAG: 3-deoxy-D-manno-octulosonic-acid transferase [Candidatus Tokpelaia sp. JSC161]|jgi:3-deoxy-D-manno-octulosonic-acid transferase|nr:MAG: 3-deoxy-D-manno-octulosonic-acid transferase [Candidatus Tokpelaia sp. JSC161]